MERGEKDKKKLSKKTQYLYCHINYEALNLHNAFLKAECTMIEFEKCENVFKGFSLWVPGLLIFIHNPCFDRRITAWACI